MPPRFRRPIAAILAVVAVLSVLGPAGAVGALLPPANVLGFDCDVEMPWFTGDVVAGSDGVTRGFARFMEGCPGQDAERIWYIEGRGSAWTRAVTP